MVHNISGLCCHVVTLDTVRIRVIAMTRFSWHWSDDYNHSGREPTILAMSALSAMLAILAKLAIAAI